MYALRSLHRNEKSHFGWKARSGCRHKKGRLMPNQSLSAAALAAQFGPFLERGAFFDIPCPAHNGDDLKLTIWDGEGGGLGARCFSRECDYKDIIEALGVAVPDRPAIAKCPVCRKADVQTLMCVYEHASSGVEVCVHRLDCVVGLVCAYPGCTLSRSKHCWDGIKGSRRGCHLSFWGEDKPSDALVLVEGEKAARALVKQGIEGYTPVSWIGGTGSVNHADYSRAQGRVCILWPDADRAGQKAMQTAVAKLRAVGAASISLVDVNGRPTGWDAADAPKADTRALLTGAQVVQANAPAVEENLDESPEYSWRTQGDFQIGRTPWEMGHDDAVQRTLRLYASHFLAVRDDRPPYEWTLFVDGGTGVWTADVGKIGEFIAKTHTQWLSDFMASSERQTMTLREIAERLRFETSLKRHSLRQSVMQSTSRVLTHWQMNESAPVALTIADASDLDRAGRYLGCVNGVLDLDAKQVLPPDEGRSKLVTRSTGLRYRADAQHDDIDAILDHLPDENRRWLLEAAGYALRGLPNRRFYMLRGEPGGGKSTILTALRLAAGEYGASIPEGALRGGRFQSAGGASPELEFAVTARIAVDSDLPDGMTLARSVVSRIAGGDEINARGLYQSFRGARMATSTMFLSTNPGRAPKLDTADDALMDRLRVLPYPPRPPEHRDVNLRARIEKSPEAPEAMLRLLVEHCPTRPPSDTPSMADERGNMRREVVGEVFDWANAAVVQTKNHSDRLLTSAVYVAALDFHQRYSDNAAGASEPWGYSQRELTSIVRSVNGMPQPDSLRDKGKVGRGWRGWRLATEEEFEKREPATWQPDLMDSRNGSVPSTQKGAS